MTGNVGKSLVHIHVLLGRRLVKLVEQHTCVGERAAKRKRGQERGERGGVQDESAPVEWHDTRGRGEEGEVGRENRKEKRERGREGGKEGKEGKKGEGREGQRGCGCAYYICVHMYIYKYIYIYI